MHLHIFKSSYVSPMTYPPPWKRIINETANRREHNPRKIKRLTILTIIAKLTLKMKAKKKYPAKTRHYVSNKKVRIRSVKSNLINNQSESMVNQMVNQKIVICFVKMIKFELKERGDCPYHQSVIIKNAI
jgi:hypothetical protein